MDTLVEALGVYEAVRKEVGPTEIDKALGRHNIRRATYRILEKVRQLINAGLLQPDDPTDYELEQTKIGVTPRGMREFETKFKETVQNVLSGEE